MKKLVSLLLAGCMVLGLAACGDTTSESSSASSTSPTSAPSSSEVSTPSSSVVEENKKPFEGVEIEVWGWAPDALSPEKATTSYLGVIAGAMDEWCEENGATVKFAGTYNQNALMAAIAGGSTPDIMCQYNIFPLVANLGLAKPISEECRAEMEKIAGTSAYTDAWSTKGESYGFQLPMQGNVMIRYDKTAFDQYGAKTPKEYWEEGNWTFDTMVECMKSVTKDLDGDGTMDTYGMSTYMMNASAKILEVGPDGKLVSLVDTPEMRKFADVIYNGVLEGYIVENKDKITSKIENPRPLMEYSDIALWELGTVWYKHKKNENIIYECVPMPGLTNEDATYMLGNYGIAKCSATDQDEAVESMLCHVLKVMMAATSEVSLGAVACEYDFLQGTTPYTQKLLELWAPYVETQKAVKDYYCYDEEYYKKLNEWIRTVEPLQVKNVYAGVSWDTKVFITDPAATSISKLKETFQTKIDTYNSLYVY